MNKNPLAAREIKAEFRIGNVVIPISGLSFMHTIDELPYATVEVQLDNLGSQSIISKHLGTVEIDIDKFNTLSRLTQEKILNDFKVTPDTQLGITDGQGDSFVLKGFLGKPRFQFREGELILSYTIVHAGAALQALNTRIYAAQSLYALTAINDFFATSETEGIQKGTSVAARIKVILQGLMKSACFLPNVVDPNQYDALPIDKLNRTVIDQALKFLDKSTPVTEIDGINLPDFINDNIYKLIYDTLVDSANFMQAIGYFGEAFMFQMNAEYDGSLWMEWKQQNTPAGKRIVKVPVQNLSFSMASIFQLPILQMLVQGQGMDAYALSGHIGIRQGDAPATATVVDPTQTIHAEIVNTGDAGIQLTALAKFPLAIPRNAAGLFGMIDAPEWLNPDLVTLGLANRIAAFGTEADRMAAVTDEIKNYDNMLTGAAKARQQIMLYMAKLAFKSLYLADTIGIVTMPLNMTVRPGYTYNVLSVTGDPLFVGYLKAVTHDINIKSEAAAALTTLEFTHVLAPGASINVLLKNPKFVTVTTTIQQALLKASELINVA